ncbi:MAG: PIN domain-containing protein [Acidobacteriota bacterium]
MRTLFADTFYYIALLSPTDAAHTRAVEFTRTYNELMVTTAWIITELADGMADASNRQAFTSFYDALRVDPQVSVVQPEQDIFNEGMELYRTRPDKDWSLTDCISFVVMRRQEITEALTGDHHFEQAGFKALLR